MVPNMIGVESHCGLLAGSQLILGTSYNRAWSGLIDFFLPNAYHLMNYGRVERR